MKTKTDKLYLTSNKKIFIILVLFYVSLLVIIFVHVYILYFIILAIIVNFMAFRI